MPKVHNVHRLGWFRFGVFMPTDSKVMIFKPWEMSSAGLPHMIQTFGVPTYSCCVMSNTLETHLTVQLQSPLVSKLSPISSLQRERNVALNKVLCGKNSRHRTCVGGGHYKNPTLTFASSLQSRNESLFGFEYV